MGSVADNPEQKIQLKNFHCEIINDHAAIKTEMDGYVPIPKPRTVTPTEIEQNYLQIKEDIVMLIESEMERIYETPELAHLLIVRE